MAKKKKKSAGASGRFAYNGLDRVLHEKARLGIMTSLFSHPDGLRFIALKELCSLTDGNLSRHLQILNEADLIEIWKGQEGNRPQTLVRLSEGGRERFLEYLEELEKVLKDAAEAADKKTASAEGDALSSGWVPA